MFWEQEAHFTSYGDDIHVRHYTLNRYFIMTDAIIIYAQRYVSEYNIGGMIEEVQVMNGVLRKMIDDNLAVPLEDL